MKKLIPIHVRAGTLVHPVIEDDFHLEPEDILPPVRPDLANRPARRTPALIPIRREPAAVFDIEVGVEGGDEGETSSLLPHASRGRTRAARARRLSCREATSNFLTPFSDLDFFAPLLLMAMGGDSMGITVLALFFLVRSSLIWAKDKRLNGWEEWAKVGDTATSYLKSGFHVWAWQSVQSQLPFENQQNPADVMRLGEDCCYVPLYKTCLTDPYDAYVKVTCPTGPAPSEGYSTLGAWIIGQFSPSSETLMTFVYASIASGSAVIGNLWTQPADTPRNIRIREAVRAGFIGITGGIAYAHANILFRRNIIEQNMGWAFLANGVGQLAVNVVLATHGKDAFKKMGFSYLWARFEANLNYKKGGRGSRAWPVKVSFLPYSAFYGAFMWTVTSFSGSVPVPNVVRSLAGGAVVFEYDHSNEILYGYQLFRNIFLNNFFCQDPASPKAFPHELGHSMDHEFARLLLSIRSSTILNGRLSYQPENQIAIMMATQAISFFLPHTDTTSYYAAPLEYLAQGYDRTVPLNLTDVFLTNNRTMLLEECLL